jgi:tetratricopeptide (TPR) repeat protein
VAYKRAAKLDPSCEQPLVRISFIYCLKWNRDGEAGEWARQGLALKPKDCYGKLVAALCNRDLDLRVGELQALIEEMPEYARPYNGLGNAFYNKKNYEDAINSYKKCIEVNGQYEHPYYGLGSIYNQLGDLDQSIIWYRRCIEISPNYDYPHYGLGIAYNNKNDMVNAIYYFKECIRINPTYDCPYYALGNIYRLAKDYPQAIHHYRQSLQHKPIDPLCFVNLALTLINVGQYQ